MMKKRLEKTINDESILEFHAFNEFSNVVQEMFLIGLLKQLIITRCNDAGKQTKTVPIICKYLMEELVNKGKLEHDSILKNRIIIFSSIHDVGKVMISEKTLKQMGKYDHDSMDEMKSHVTLGADYFKVLFGENLSNGSMIGYNIIKYHHERYDGTGYPEGLKGEEIPLEARIVALADVFDALISKRRYKDAVDFQKAHEYIVSQSNKHFDPIVVEAFTKSIVKIEKIYLGREEET